MAENSDPDLRSDDLRAIVREEINSAAIRDLVAEATKKPSSFWDLFFRHPLFITFAGFLLTSGLLWVVQLVIEQNEKDRLARADIRMQISAEADAAIELLDELVLLAHNRATELSLLRFALIDGQKDVILARNARYYDFYREWVTTYQPRARKILTQMGVSAMNGAEVEADPFYTAIQTRIGWQAFLQGHACYRRMMVVAHRTAFKPYGRWDADELFQCPPKYPRGFAPAFLRESYTIARSCATQVFFYARDRIRAYETARKKQVDDPDAPMNLPDPMVNFPEACVVG